MASSDMNRWKNKLPYGPGTMALGGAVVVGGIWYYMTYMRKKPEADARDAAKVARPGITRPEETPPRNKRLGRV
ncbi:hypothetical protein RND71_032310 [Anisodus tanguticus]|uniref:Uncharacterized protein n=1 Tax=Anisodus tanguticus TaxID=243964 RepID=A0AAE1V6N1_9SOLA|nr:hypothetical protein RND71_032310 [Anisodus tanguticus]